MLHRQSKRNIRAEDANETISGPKQHFERKQALKKSTSRTPKIGALFRRKTGDTSSDCDQPCNVNATISSRRVLRLDPFLGFQTSLTPHIHHHSSSDAKTLQNAHAVLFESPLITELFMMQYVAGPGMAQSRHHE